MHGIHPIILAAGPSELSFPKALARFGERTALEIALANCTGLGKPIVVLGSDSSRVRPFVPQGAEVVVNRRWRSGQLSSLAAALRRLPRDADFLLYPVDYPLLTRDVITRLADAFVRRAAGKQIVVPRFRGRGGHPVVFSHELRRELLAARNARKVVYRDPARVHFVGVRTPAIWLDLDSPAAYRNRLKQFARRSKSLEEHLRVTGPATRMWKESNAKAAADDLRSCLCEIRDGLDVSRDLALRLLACPDDLLPELLATAVALKERFKPGVVTYSRKVFLPLTNLCRDYCGYCIFRRSPGEHGAHTMTPDEVLEVAHQGERRGCREALFSLGDKPELAFPEMRETLRHLGYRSTLHYLESMCELVLRETALIPHANPGLMSAAWLERLRAVSPSIGLMLETTSTALLGPGAAHDNAPDKIPARRLATIEAAGRLRIPFTTGILVGIGETAADRVDSLLAIRNLHRRYGHIQEVIIQNFRVKPGISMSAWPEPPRDEMLRTVAVARFILRDMNIQAPPNLSAPDYESLLSAGINDWGGVSPLTPDFINPERPWPHLEELERRTAAAGCQLRQRLPVYPEFLPMVAAAGKLAAEKTLAAADDLGFAKPPLQLPPPSPQGAAGSRSPHHAAVLAVLASGGSA